MPYIFLKTISPLNTEENIRIKSLIEGCLNNDRMCQRGLYGLYFGYAMSICLRYAQNRDEAIEMVNDGFMKIFTRLESYDSERSFKSWMGRIMVNTAIDGFRLSHKHYGRHDGLEEASSLAFDEQVLDKLAYDDLLLMIQGLPPSYRTVFNLHIIDGYKHEEIAERLSISVGTSKSNLHKAREILKRNIANRQQDEEKRMGKGLFTKSTLNNG